MSSKLYSPNDDEVQDVAARKAAKLDRLLRILHAKNIDVYPGEYAGLSEGALDIKIDLELDDDEYLASAVIDKPNGHGTTKPHNRRATAAFKPGQGFYLKCPVDAAIDPNLSNRDVRYLVMLQAFCRNKDHCWPSQKTLATAMPGVGSRTRNSLDTVQRALAKLAKHGYIEIIPWHKLKERGYDHVTQGNTYRLNFQIK